MNRRLLTGLLVLAVTMGSEVVRAQKAPPAKSQEKTSIVRTSELTAPILKEIQDIEERTVAIAEDFPDDLYNTYRPKGNPDVRTAAEILLHIAEQNQSYASLMRTKQQEALIASGKKPSAKEILTYVSKPDTVTKVKASFPRCAMPSRTTPIRRSSNTGSTSSLTATAISAIS